MKRKRIIKFLVIVLIIYLLFLIISLFHQNIELIKLQESRNENRLDKLDNDIKRIERVLVYQHDNPVIQKETNVIYKDREKITNPTKIDSPSLVPLVMAGVIQLLKTIVNPIKNLGY